MLNGVCGAPPTFDLPPLFVLTARLDKSVYFLSWETVSSDLELCFAQPALCGLFTLNS